MSKSWAMNLEGHTPTFGATVPDGEYLVETVKTVADDDDKGNFVRFSHKIISGPRVSGKEEGDYSGQIISDRLWVVDDDFKGTEGHAQVLLDNWYYLLNAYGLEVTNYPDMRALADDCVGLRLVVKTTTNKSKKPDRKTGEYREFTNVATYLPAGAWGDSNPSEGDSDPDEGEDVTMAETVDLSNLE